MNYETILFDRIEKIKQINAEYDLENNAYISFSGGKDSTILHYLIDLALPGNKIPRVFCNTGIEYKMIVDFVKELAENDDRIQIITTGKNIKNTLNEVGYPFKSKQHSHNLAIYQKSGLTKTNISYLGLDDSTSMFRCPKNLEYQFTDNFKIKCSDMCCNELKKKPFKKYEKEFNKTITLTGMRASEGGSRKNLNCIIIDKDNNLKKFHPLAVLDDRWCDLFIKENNINLAKVYYEPYNFRRTGCKGCPFTLDLQKQLDTMQELLPNEYKACEVIWKPIYEEYRRIGYRLRKGDNQMTIFDVL